MRAHRSATPYRQRELPPFYYRDHFRELLDFVRVSYAHALAPQHERFIDEFSRLSQPAQCLYVRLVNRKGRVFRKSRLRYPDIGDLAAPLAELAGHGWVAPPGADHYVDLVDSLTRRELVELLLPEFPGLARSLRKKEYLSLALDVDAPEKLLASIDVNRFVTQRRYDDVQYLMYLYFGRLPDGLEKFTMRDLGVVRVQNFTSEFEPRFEAREEALENYYYACRLHDLEKLGRTQTLTAILDERDRWPEPKYTGAARLRDRLALKLGRAAERAGNRADAIATYRTSPSADCSERLVRTLLAVGEREEAKQLLLSYRGRAARDSRWLFADDLYGRKFGGERKTPATALLQDAPGIELDESWTGSPERGAVEWFRKQDQRAWRVENSLWRTLFGLLFWEQLFGEDSTSIHSPFEWRPEALSNGRFLAQHQSVIDARLAGLDDTAATAKQLLKTSTRHYGTKNGVFRWRRQTLEALFAFLQAVPGAALAAPLNRMCRRFSEYCHGYPDLLVIDDGGARLVEVKAEGDQLRPNQLRRLRELNDAGLRADVLNVAWHVDPEQEYVVVDLETTGGRGADHRITEFAGLRVRNGREIGRFQSLVNPRRGIPPSITRLTGISGEMVADAPYFDELIDRIDDFTADAVFVAHNVSFDYGFLRHEFARLGRTFRRPRLCTVTSMRKWYPGLRSYSLAALCAEFGIPLRQHHRAMCDAEAAAELLDLVNHRRMAASEAGPTS